MLTDEQKSVVDSVLDGYHVSLTALPGSGKSKVAYDIIERCPDSNILMIAYNRALNDKSNKCIEALQLPASKRTKSYTFHSLISILSSTLCSNDEQFSNALTLLKTKESMIDWKYADFSLLIIDETQDVRPSYFELIRLLVTSVCTKPEKLRILLLGDTNQLLYNFYHFDRADARFLTLGPYLFPGKRQWKTLQLTRSFRSTFAVASFLNAIVPDHRMLPRNMNPCEPVDLYICNVYKDPAKLICSIVNKYQSIFQPSEILILCPSLNERSPAKPVVRALIRAGFKVTVNRSGRLSDINETTSGEHTTNNIDTIRMKTYCSSKGLEAPLTILINSRRELFHDIDNSTYVALSRSVEKLIIFQDRSFVTADQVYNMYTRIIDPKKIVQTYIVPLQYINNENKNLPQIHTLCDIAKQSPQLLPLTIEPNTGNVEYKTLQQLFTYVHMSVLHDLQQYYHSITLCKPVEDIVFEDHPVLDKKNNKLVRAETDTILVPHITNLDGTYTRLFDHGDNNMMNIIGQVCELLIEFHFNPSYTTKYSKIRKALQ